MIITIWCLIEKNLIKWSLVIYCFMKKYTHDINSLYLVHCYDYDHLHYSLDWGKKFCIAVKSRSKNFNFIYDPLFSLHFHYSYLLSIFSFLSTFLLFSFLFTSLPPSLSSHLLFLLSTPLLLSLHPSFFSLPLLASEPSISTI